MNDKFDPFALIKRAVFGLLGFAVLLGGLVIALRLLVLALRKRGIEIPRPPTFGTFNREANGKDSTPTKRYRRAGAVLSKAEVNFYAVLAHAVYPELVVFPKMRVTDLINQVDSRYSSTGATAWNQIAQKHVDFVLCHSASLELAGVVELDDRSHDRADRKARDQLVDQAFADAGVRILHVQCQQSYSQPDTRRIVLQELGFQT